jgi:phytoene dehydrogenase-like protein
MRRYDALILGAGMSGLAAGIRLAQAGRRVAILERHSLWGGLNSFYKLAGRRFDTGLHALTNFVPKGARGAPLTRILRQLRIPYDELRLRPQAYSEIAFLPAPGGARLRFSNDLDLLRSEVARAFPAEVGGFERLLLDLPAYEGFGRETGAPDARAELAARIRDPLLREMLLLPVLYYGAAGERTLPWDQFGVLFRSIFLEGFSRPEGGIKRLLDLLVARFRAEGGDLRLRSAVERVLIRDGAARGVALSGGTELVADREAGVLSFMETLSVLDRPCAELGHGAAVTFFNAAERARWQRPDRLTDPTGGVISCPDNYRSSEPPREGLMRVTVLADHARWTALEPEDYRAAKARESDAALASAARFAPDPRPHTVFRDVFTPRTIERFTGHANGAVYGSPRKHPDGTTAVRDLFLIGTDQGLVGVIGALVSGITVVNRHALLAAERAG